MAGSSPHRVVIAGGGVAGLEALIALRELAGGRVELMLIAPDEEFVIRALSVQEPFARPAPRRFSVPEIAAAHGASFRRDAIASVDGASRTATTGTGEAIPYDSLLVAVGAEPVPAYDRITSFRGAQDAEAMHGIVQDVEGGYSRSVAFVVPPGVTWSLPLYELALMTAERASSLGMDVDLTVVTPEERPLGIFGRHACEAVEEALRQAGITVIGSAYARDVEGGAVLGADGDVIARAQRIVALPRLTAPRLEGLPTDPGGFVRVDEYGRVPDTPGVYAAGDGTTFPIKQGGIAAQQADAAARAIAREAGADIEPRPFRPELQAKLLTGTRATYLREAITGGAGDASSTATEEALWWPPTKVAAPYLAPYLERAG